jgi:hypothetical protein
MALLLVPLLWAGLDAGVQVGGVFPSVGLAPIHASSALFGAHLGHRFGPSRLELGYSYAGLPGPQASAYRLDVHDVALRYWYEFVHRPDWGLAVNGGAGYSFLRRNLLSAHESGRSPAALVGLGFVQHQGHNYLALGLDNSVFIGSRGVGADVHTAVAWLICLKARVGYAF